ncbi:MAG TPA: 16S rRNA (cytidine(1402)-2'-O)-methyltransferase [Geminicoccaceae bacterium]|nr:16S rRNA (cytidine(1402)-2'-O)-methyltransferase [Geminicoccaceae bacterium]
MHLVATPIGNLGDLSPRALATLRDAEVVLCEDTRVTAKLLGLCGLGRALQGYHEHNAARVRPQVLERLRAGAAVALVSDAGTPLVSDPGYKLVRDAIAAGVEVFAVPGPSAALAGLLVSGLPTDRFFVAGFLPTRRSQRRRAIAELAPVPGTLIVFEAARRLPDTLADLAAELGPRPAAVARELTKRFEEVRRGALGELAAHYAESGPPRGETMIVIGPGARAATEPSAAELDALLAEALESRAPAAAAAAVAAATGQPRRDLYRRALALQGR